MENNVGNVKKNDEKVVTRYYTRGKELIVESVRQNIKK